MQGGKVFFQSKVGPSMLRGEGLYLFGLEDGSQNFTGSTRRRRCHRDCETEEFIAYPVERPADTQTTQLASWRSVHLTPFLGGRTPVGIPVAKSSEH